MTNGACADDVAFAGRRRRLLFDDAATKLEEAVPQMDGILAGRSARPANGRSWPLPARAGLAK